MTGLPHIEAGKALRCLEKVSPAISRHRGRMALIFLAYRHQKKISGYYLTLPYVLFMFYSETKEEAMPVELQQEFL